MRHHIQKVGTPGLTLLCHPDPSRVGEQALLSELLSGSTTDLSRSTPHFAPPDGGTPRPLADPHLSRRPLRFAPFSDGGIRMDPRAVKHPVRVDHRVCTQPLEIDAKALDAGVVLVLNPLVAVLLHSLPQPQKRPPRFDLIGENHSMLRLRHEIQRLAQLEYPILLRGESGTGKELVARALHLAGPRKDRPCVCLNMGAIPSSVAAAELFGNTKGAFTGAEQRRSGYFQRADGGTLFLDEIGDTPADVQALLLRALETRQIQPLGTSDVISVDVRLISATDIDLEVAMELGELRSSLFHRLAGCELELPSLRDRRDDIGRLFFHFLRKEIDSVSAAMADAKDLASPFPQITADLVANLTTYRWPGNVRELRNVVRQLVVSNWRKEKLQLPDNIARRLLQSSEQPDYASNSVPRSETTQTGTRARRQPEGVSERELLEALQKNRWNVHQTAKTLNLARASLYRLMRDSPNVRKASDVSYEELSEALHTCQGSLESMVDRLQVSKRGLQLRMSELGLSKGDAPTIVEPT